MSLINPFKVQFTDSNISLKEINNITDVIVDELVMNQPELVTGVQEGTKSKALQIGRAHV